MDCTTTTHTLLCPIPTAQTLKQGFASGRYALTEVGLERRCSSCSDLWPADTEFFYPQPNSPSGLHCWCKDCYIAWKAQNARKRYAKTT